MGKSLMDMIMEQATNERLDAVLMQDKVFLDLQERLDHAIEEFDRLGLTKEQRQRVDRMVSAYTESGAYHSAMAYRQGFRDCADFLVEIVPDKMEHLHGKEECKECSLHNIDK